MEPRTRAIVLGAIALFVLALAVAIIFYVSRVAQNKGGGIFAPLATATATPTPVVITRLTPTQGSQPSVTATTTPTSIPSNLKLYQGDNFVLYYPSSWGILTCNNSANFEFDPTNSAVQKNFPCDRAMKPVTVIITKSLICRGDNVVLGGNQVVKSKSVSEGGYVEYNWCLNVAGHGFNITHRVSPTPARAASKDDFSAQVEQMISTIQPTPRGS